MMQKKFFVALKAWCWTLLLAAMLLLNSADGLAAENDPAAKAELDAAYKAMKEVNNGTVEADVLLDTAFVDVNGKLNISFLSKPAVRGEGKFHMTVGGLDKPSTTDYPFYIAEDGKAFTLYYQDKGKWYKDTYSEDDKKGIEKRVDKEDPAYKEFEKELEGIEETVRFGKGDALRQTYLVNIDGTKFWPAVKKYMSAQIKPGDKDAENVRSIINSIDNLGDLEYEVTVEKATKRVVAAKMDLSGPVSKLAVAVVKNAPLDDKTRVLVTAALSEAKMVLNMNGSQYNQVNEIKIPENVVKNAKPAPKKDKKDGKDKK